MSRSSSEFIVMVVSGEYRLLSLTSEELCSSSSSAGVKSSDHSGRLFPL